MQGQTHNKHISGNIFNKNPFLLPPLHSLNPIPTTLCRLHDSTRMSIWNERGQVYSTLGEFLIIFHNWMVSFLYPCFIMFVYLCPLFHYSKSTLSRQSISVIDASIEWPNFHTFSMLCFPEFSYVPWSASWMVHPSNTCHFKFSFKQLINYSVLFFKLILYVLQCFMDHHLHTFWSYNWY